MVDPVSAAALGTAVAGAGTAGATAGTVLTGSAAAAAVSAGTATATTAGLFGAAGSFSLGATLSTLGTGFSIFSTLQGGAAANAQSEAEARQIEFQARQEEVRGKEEANTIKRDLASALATANARGAASGISLSSGSPLTAQQQALRDANNALSTAGTNAKLRAAQGRLQAQIVRRRGANSVRTGITQSASLLGDFTQNIQDRGGFTF